MTPLSANNTKLRIFFFFSGTLILQIKQRLNKTQFGRAYEIETF